MSKLFVGDSYRPFNFLYFMDSEGNQTPVEFDFIPKAKEPTAQQLEAIRAEQIELNELFGIYPELGANHGSE